jgi:outer membrane biosynthesis protein TonB
MNALHNTFIYFFLPILVTPVKPVKPAPAKPAPKPAPAKPKPAPKPAPAKPKPAPKPAPAVPKPVQAVPLTAKPVPIATAPIAAVPTQTPVTAAPAVFDIYGYYSSDTLGECYGQLSFVSWSSTDQTQASISYQQGATAVSSGVYNTATNRGTINFPGNAAGFTFDPPFGLIQWDAGGGNVYRVFTNCADTARLFDGSTSKWKVLGSTAVIEVLTCDHTVALPGFRIYAADTFPALDPNYYWLRGYKYSTNTWVTIKEGAFTLSSARNAPGMALNDPNANYYEVRYTVSAINTDIYDKYVIGLQRLGAPALQLGEIVLLKIAMTPTKKPTKAPTMKPTNTPTKNPTKTPTKSPTSSPTITPQFTCTAPTTTPQVCDNGLVPGDVVVTAFNTDTGSGAQTVVLLTSSQKLNKGDTIYMTDRPLNCDANCNCDFLPLDQTYMDGTVMVSCIN